MINIECRKHTLLKPLHNFAKTILPVLEISAQNIATYASLANYYTIYDLERFDDERTYLYLLCYAFKRYQQISDNLILDFGQNYSHEPLILLKKIVFQNSIIEF
jgi:hypothetical protein